MCDRDIGARRVGRTAELASDNHALDGPRRVPERARDLKRAHEAREGQRRAQEAQEGRRAQEEREKEVKAGGARKTGERRKSSGGAKERRRVKAQEGYEGKEEMTRQEESVEEKKETNSTQEGNDVSNRHMTWWKNAWWIRVGNGPHLRTARGRRRTWRAARGRPNRPVMKIGSKRPRAWPKRQREKMEKKEMEPRENQKRRKQHPAHCLPLRKRNNPNNSSSSNRSSAVTCTVTVMVDNEVLYDICHCEVDDGSAFDRNRRIYDIFGDCSNTSMTNMYAADPSGDAIQFDGPWASCPSSGSGRCLSNAWAREHARATHQRRAVPRSWLVFLSQTSG